MNTTEEIASIIGGTVDEHKEISELKKMFDEAISLRAEIKSKTETLKGKVDEIAKAIGIEAGEKYSDGSYYFEVLIQHRKKLNESELNAFLSEHKKSLKDFQIETENTSNRYGRVEK